MDIIPAQNVFKIEDGKSGIMSVRSSQIPDSCRAYHKASRTFREVVDGDFSDGEEMECERNYEGSRVCVEQYEDDDDGIYACQVKISDMSKDLEGEWQVRIEAGDDEKKVDFELEIEEDRNESSESNKEDTPRLVNVEGRYLTICVRERDVDRQTTIKVEFEVTGGIDEVNMGFFSFISV